MGHRVEQRKAPGAIGRFQHARREAGLPDGVINLIYVDGPVAGDVIFKHPDFAGIHFTGSTKVFQTIWQTIGENISKYKTYPRIVGETGGKDFVSKAQNLLGLAPTMGNVFTYVMASFVGVVFILTNIQLISRLGEFSKLKNNGSFVSTVNELGMLLVKDHILAFEISSVLLLGALVGAAIIARPRKQ